MRRRSLKRSALVYALVTFLLLVVFLPMVWIFLTSLKTPQEIMNLRASGILPRNPTFVSYVQLFEQSDFGRYFLNSTIVSLASTLITILLCAPAAYSVFRCRYPARNLFFRLFISIYTFPKVLLLVPLYIVFARIGLIDRLAALVIINVTIAAPLGVWLLRAFFTAIPLDLEEAALIDGANRLQVLVRIFLPIAAPGVGAVAINTFLMSWSEYLFASTFIISDPNKTLPPGMAYFLQSYNIDWSIMAAGSVLMALPPIVGFAITGRFFISGLTAGAVK